MAVLLYSLCFACFTSGFAMFAERTFIWEGKPFTPREIGYLFAYTGFLGIVLQGGLISRLVRRFGEPSLVSAGFITLCISYLGLSMAHTVPALVLVATISSFGNGVMRPSLSSLISQISQRHEQGVVMGLSQSLHSLAALIAPPLAGWLIEKPAARSGPGWPLWARRWAWRVHVMDQVQPDDCWPNEPRPRQLGDSAHQAISAQSTAVAAKTPKKIMPRLTASRS